MGISNRTYTIIVITIIILLILAGIWIVKAVSNVRIEEKNYTIEHDIEDKIDAVVNADENRLNDIETNEILERDEIFRINEIPNDYNNDLVNNV